MILDNTQWIRLQKTVQQALPFFKTYNLYPEIIKSFERVSDASLYELQQIRTYDDWPIFLGNVKEEDKSNLLADLAMILNFANGVRGIDWPYYSSKENHYQELMKEFKENLKKNEEWRKSWGINHTFFGKYSVGSFLHIDPNLYGKGVWYSKKVDFDNGKYKKEIGLVVSEKDYVPISVEF